MEPEEFMKPLWDGLLVLKDHWQLVLGILSLILLSYFPIYAGMKLIFSKGLTEEEYLSLGMAGWLLPASLLSLLWHGLRAVGLPQSNALILAILPGIFALLYFLRAKKQPAPHSKVIGLSLLFLLAIFSLLRLAFISKTLL